MPLETGAQPNEIASFEQLPTDSRAASRITIRPIDPPSNRTAIAQWAVERTETDGARSIELERGGFGIIRDEHGFVARLAFRGLARSSEVDEAIVGIVLDAATTLGIARLRISGDSSIRVAMARMGVAADDPAKFGDDVATQAAQIVRYRLDMSGWGPRVREQLVATSVDALAAAVGQGVGPVPEGQPTATDAMKAVAQGNPSRLERLVAQRATTMAGPSAVVGVVVSAPDGSGSLPVGEWLVSGISWSGRIDSRFPRGR